jgi:hypothetical protein
MTRRSYLNSALMSAVAAGLRGDHVPRRFAGGAGRRRAELERKVVSLLQRIHHHHGNFRVRRFQHQQVEQAHAARTQHHRKSPIPDACAPYAAQHAGGGLHEDGGFVGERFREAACGLAHGASAYQHDLRKAAGLQQVFPEYRAHGFAAVQAEMAFAAGNVVGYHHPVARIEARNAFAARHHLAYELVSEHRTGQQAARIELEKIRAAKTHDAQPEQQLVGARHRRRTRFDSRSVASQAGNNVVGGHGHQCSRLLSSRFSCAARSIGGATRHFKRAGRHRRGVVKSFCKYLRLSWVRILLSMRREDKFSGPWIFPSGGLPGGDEW